MVLEVPRRLLLQEKTREDLGGTVVFSSVFLDAGADHTVGPKGKCHGAVCLGLGNFSECKIQ